VDITSLNKKLTMRLAVSTQYQRVTDGQTDGIALCAASHASAW